MDQKTTTDISRSAMGVDTSAHQDGSLDDLTPAVQNLGERGKKLQRRGLKLAIVTAILAVITAVVALTAMALAPADSFSSVELPPLKELAPKDHGTSPFGAMGMTPGLSVKKLQKAMNILAAVLGGLLLVAGVITGETFRFFSIGIAFAVLAGMFNMAATVLNPQSGDDDTSRFERYYYVAQVMAKEGRYADLLAFAHELMTAEKVAYVSAQIAYIQRDSAATQEKLAALPPAERSLRAERVAVMERFAYGEVTSPEAIQFDRDSQARLATVTRLSDMLLAITVVWGLVAVGYLGLSRLIRRRTSRLETLLQSIGEPQSHRAGG